MIRIWQSKARSNGNWCEVHKRGPRLPLDPFRFSIDTRSESLARCPGASADIMSAAICTIVSRPHLGTWPEAALPGYIWGRQFEQRTSPYIPAHSHELPVHDVFWP